MEIPGFIGDLFKRFLDIILPTESDKVLQHKRVLGRYLVRTSGIIEAYCFECDRLRRELRGLHDSIDQKVLFLQGFSELPVITEEEHKQLKAFVESLLGESGGPQAPSDPPETPTLKEPLSHMGELLAARVKRLSNLSREFASMLSEMAYLRLFDVGMHEALMGGLAWESGVAPNTPVGIASEADAASQSAVSERGILLFPHPGSTEMTKPVILDFHRRKDLETLNEYLRQTVQLLQEAQGRLSNFVSQNFTVWELFGAREEYHSPSSTA